VTKTYAVHAVVDVRRKRRLSFREAIDQNIFDPDKGSYLNTATNEKLYVADAIKKGLIKVRLHRALILFLCDCMLLQSGLMSPDHPETRFCSYLDCKVG